MTDWISDAFIYHLYPLGFCGAPRKNDFSSPPVPRLRKTAEWLDHIQGLGANTLMLGPLFESTSHGYDTADYYHVDRRLGDRAELGRLSRDLQDRDMRLVLDGVFNHVGRDFWAFRDVLQHGEHSAYRDWFRGLQFGVSSPYGDPFTYESWSGHFSLVRLNQANPAVREHLFQAVAMWIEEFGIAGLRLDAADSLEPDFMRALSAFCRTKKPDFWLMGEVIHGDYRGWANPEMLDSVTNYEVYKSLYSSHVDRNYFELAYALNRQSGEGGIYRDLRLVNFADNHDVDRVASRLDDPRHLYPLHILLFTIPGIPSVYYGSEWGISGRRSPHSDLPLRPSLDLSQVEQESPNRDLAQSIRRLAGIRQSCGALRGGYYQQLEVRPQQFAFARQRNAEASIVLVNAAAEEAAFDLRLPPGLDGVYRDLLSPGETFTAQNSTLKLSTMPVWGRILVR